MGFLCVNDIFFWSFFISLSCVVKHVYTRKAWLVRNTIIVDLTVHALHVNLEL